MTPQDVDFLHGVALNRAGLNLGADLAYVAEMRLSAVARREGADAASDLVARARTTGDARLIDALVEALAPQESAFFRDPAVFARLCGEVIPAIARARPERTVRVWSAGCGGGQEVYSVALGAAERPEALRGVDLQLFGSDLSARQLQKARSGVYSHFEVQRGLPIRMLLRGFARTDDMWRLEPDIRQRVRWARINLMDDLSRLGGFDVILCRDVLPHMDPGAARGVASRLAALLPPDGRLVLGARETLPLAGWVGSGGVFVREAAEVVQAA
ncbi:MAG: protein-glutamate O-methyltransferase CheR [Caulobacteraceae bacterium]|nr:protein-glutamate O-methyltransferase CheR [Caulobacter sp.]